MSLVAMKVPDIGEGVAEVELTEWSVSVGDLVREDETIALVMSDKATVEVPAAASGTVTWLGGAVGDTLAVGSEFVRIDTDASAGPSAGESGEAEPAATEATDADASADEEQPPATPERDRPAPDEVEDEPHDPQPEAAKAPPAEPARPRPAAAPPQAKGGGIARTARSSTEPLALPSVRRRAREMGLDLRNFEGTGPCGRVTHEDLDAFSSGPVAMPARGRTADPSVEERAIVGLRRMISRRMTVANAIPHITIVEEVDVGEVERLRAALNRAAAEGDVKLTVLPFIVRAVVRAVQAQGGLNAHFDAETERLTVYGGVHLAIATQTPGGLVTPVVRHAEALGLRQTAAEIVRLAEAARAGTASREEMTGSTITITSLGPLGAIATTPILNPPEVAIVGVNRMETRVVWRDGGPEPRLMMNLSSSFDHRVIDGWDAAVFVQRLKTLIETPGLMFAED